MPQIDTKLHPGDIAPDFTLGDVQGKTHQLSAALKDGPVLLFFFRGTWCSDCRDYLKELEGHYKQFVANGVQVLGMAHQRADIVAGYFKLEPISFPYLLDTDLKVIDRFGLLRGFAVDALIASRAGSQTTHPACFLIDESGTIRWMYVGDGKRDLPHIEQLDAEVARLGLASKQSAGGEG